MDWAFWQRYRKHFGDCLWVPPVNARGAFGRAAIPVQATTKVATAKRSDEYEHEPEVMSDKTLLVQRHEFGAHPQAHPICMSMISD